MLVKRTLLVLAFVSSAVPAYAAPTSKSRDPVALATKAACLAAHEGGQALRTQKKLHAARERFLACAKSECPAVLRKECGEQVEALEADAPSLAFEARDEKGSADPSVKVSIDGEVVTDHLTGASIDVEPGEHAIRFERADGKVIEQKILVVEGEKNRKVVAEYASLVPKPPPDNRFPSEQEKKQVPIASYVAGGVAVLALGSFALFALTGKGKENDLAGSCSPNCKPDDVSAVNRDYLIADVSLGVAAVAAVVAVVLAFPAFGSSPSVKTASAAAPWFPKKRSALP
jgi:hypothetical protein